MADDADNSERHEPQVNAITLPPSLLEKIDRYISEQTEAERGKRRREIVTISGLYLTAFLAFSFDSRWAGRQKRDD